jgi:hypothetical protein
MATLELVYTGAVGGDATCPPEDVYTLVLQEYEPPQARPVFEDRNKPLDEARMQNQIKATFRIVGVPDNDDEEYTEWLGQTLNDWITIPKNPLHEKAKIGNLVRAITNTKEFEVGEKLDLEDMVEKPFKATITAKPSGWPKIDNFMPARKIKVKAPVAKKVVLENTDEEGGDEWPEE